MLVLVAITVIQLFVLIPEMKDAAARLKRDRDAESARNADEIHRSKLLDEARKRQVVNEATVLTRQEENLRLAKEIEDTLKGIRALKQGD